MSNLKFITIITIILGFTGCANSSVQDSKIVPTNSPVATSTPKIATPKPTVSPTPVDEKLEEKYQEAYSLYNNYNYKDAIKVTDEILKIQPNHYKALTIRGIATCYSDTLENGMKYLDKALEINPDYGYARYNKALAYERFRQLDNAILWYNKALEVEEYVWTYYGIASVYGRRGDVENTVKYLKRASELDAVVKELAPKEKDFQKLWNHPDFKSIME